MTSPRWVIIALSVNGLRSDLGIIGSIYSDVSKVKVVVPPLSRTILVSTEASHFDSNNKVYFARIVGNDGPAPAILRKGNAREHFLAEPKLAVTNFEIDGSNLSFDVTSDCYAHAVYFDHADDARLSDEYFDLLPGETRHIAAQVDDLFVSDMVVRARSIHRVILC